MVHLNHENKNPSCYNFLIDCCQPCNVWNHEFNNSWFNAFCRNHENWCRRIKVLSWYITIQVHLKSGLIGGDHCMIFGKASWKDNSYQQQKRPCCWRLSYVYIILLDISVVLNNSVVKLLPINTHEWSCRIKRISVW